MVDLESSAHEHSDESENHVSQYHKALLSDIMAAIQQDRLHETGFKAPGWESWCKLRVEGPLTCSRLP